MSDHAATPVLTTGDGTTDPGAVLAGPEGALALEVLEREIRDGDHDAEGENRFLGESTRAIACGSITRPTRPG